MTGGMVVATGHQRRNWQRACGGLAALLVVGGALLAAFRTGANGGQLTGGVESAAAGAATALGTVATALPLGYAFGAGLVAAVNPCGFALLPAYLGLYLGDAVGPAQPSRPGARLRRAVWVSALMTTSFVALFGLVGLLLRATTVALVRVFPWLGLAVGLLLVLIGGLLLGGGTLYASLGGRLAGHIGAQARQPGSRGYLAYGLAYGLASLGCTLPIFLTVVGSGLTVRGFLAAAGQFALYALGMGTVLTMLTLSAAAFAYAALRGVRCLQRYVQPTSAILVLLTGGYLIYYWLTLGGLLTGAGIP